MFLLLYNMIAFLKKINHYNTHTLNKNNETYLKLAVEFKPSPLKKQMSTVLCPFSHYPTPFFTYQR